MGKILNVFKSCLGRKSPEVPYRPRGFPPYTTDFRVNPENSFAVKMFKAVIESSNSSNANIIVSPFSVEAILAALLPGTNGELQSALMELFCQDGRDFPELIRNLDVVNTDGALNTVNAAFYDGNCRLASEYRETIEGAMKFGFIKTPFADSPGEALATVNNFVAEWTDGDITSLMNEVDRQTLLILVNIINFSGQWEYAFDKQNTRSGTFYCPNNVEKTVDFMENRDAYIRVYNVTYRSKNAEVGDPHMIILNIVERKFSVMLLLPAKDTGGISSLEKDLTIEKLLMWCQKSTEDMFYIVIPKFRISCGLDLIPGATGMGLQSMFEPSVTNFDRMFENDSRPKQVDQFRQEAVIELDEWGIKASTATSCGIEYTSLSEPDFVADHPFLLIIWNEITNVPVFIGRITEPK